MEVGTGKELVNFSHKGGVEHGAFSRDGQRLVTAASDRTARVWDTATGKPVTPYLEHQGRVTWAAFSPQWHRVVTASTDATARIWSVATGKPVALRLLHENEVKQASFSPDGRWFVTASTEFSFFPHLGRGYRPACFAPAQTQRGRGRGAFAPDSRSVLTASFDNSARVWDFRPDERPLPDLLQLSLVLAGHAHDPTGEVTFPSATAVARAWRNVRSKYPDDFITSEASVRAAAWTWPTAVSPPACGKEVCYTWTPCLRNTPTMATATFTWVRYTAFWTLAGGRRGSGTGDGAETR